jgi:hypothetical protein
VRGSTLAAVVVATLRPWRQTLPRWIDVDGEREDLYDEGDEARRGVDVWRIGDSSALTLRRAGRLWVVQHVADLPGGGSVVVVYVPRDCPRALAILQRLPQRARWLVVPNAAGEHLVPSLNSATDVVALAVKSVWPTWWRRRRAGDDPGDPINGVPASPPTGAVLVGSVLL